MVSRATEAHRATARAVVHMLIEQCGCRIVALAEVRRENVLEWVPEAVRRDWDAIADVSGEQHDFDVAILHDRRLLREATEPTWVSSYHARQRVRAGLVTTFDVSDGRAPLTLAVAHWRSDARNHADGSDRRSKAAESLRVAIAAQVRDFGGDAAPVLVLGDFNAEPFDPPFGAGLPAARFRDVVRRFRSRAPDDLLFYNAAWRWLGEREPWDGAERPASIAGTYRTDKNEPTAWRTFDQVLGSPALLGESGWCLDERALGVHDGGQLFVRESSCIRKPFDHLPVVGHLRWLTPGKTSGE